MLFRTIVRVDSVRKDNVRFPEGTMVMKRVDSYTDTGWRLLSTRTG